MTDKKSERPDTSTSKSKPSPKVETKEMEMATTPDPLTAVVNEVFSLAHDNVKKDVILGLKRFNVSTLADLRKMNPMQGNNVIRDAFFKRAIDLHRDPTKSAYKDEFKAMATYADQFGIDLASATRPQIALLLREASGNKDIFDVITASLGKE